MKLLLAGLVLGLAPLAADAAVLHGRAQVAGASGREAARQPSAGGLHPEAAARRRARPPARMGAVALVETQLFEDMPFVEYVLYIGGAVAVVVACTAGCGVAGSAGGSSAGATDGATKAAEAPKETDKEPGEGVDVERLTKLVVQHAAQQVGPKVTKAMAVKGVLESRVRGLKDKAVQLVLDECLGTLGRVLREANAEEFMLVLNPGASGASNLPGPSILLAGLLTPMVLVLSLIIHLMQVIMVLIPTLVMCFLAIYTDWLTLPGCAVPTILTWVWAQAALSVTLTVSHLATVVQLFQGKRTINEKVDGMKDRIVEAVADGELDVDEIRELFVILSVLLEHSLVIEDKLRRSVWRKVIGYGTMLWLVMTLWTFVLVLGWTFVPGMVAFHEAARDAPEYCGAWATVLTARLSCVLSMFFLMFNLLSISQFMSDSMVVSEDYMVGVLAWARRQDQGMLGVPVVQTLVKAFLLRGTSESLGSQIAQSRDQSQALEAEKASLKRQIAAMNSRIRHHKAEAVELRKAAGLPEPEEDTALAQMMSDQAKAKAKELEESTRKEIEQMYSRVVKAAGQLQEQGAEALAQAKSQAREAAAAGAEAAQAAAAAGAEAAQAMREGGFEGAKEQLEAGRARAAEFAAQASSQAQELASQASLEAGRARAAELAASASSQAQEYAARVSSQAEDLAAQVASQAEDLAAQAEEQSPRWAFWRS